MINDDNDSRTLSNSDSIIIPVTTDNNKLEWDGNPATIAGMLYAVERFFTRVGLFQSSQRPRRAGGRLRAEPPACWLVHDYPHETTRTVLA